MYIIKAAHKGNAFMRSSDAYVEAETEDQAIEIYTKIINEYPHSVNVEVFKSEKVEMPSHILEESLKRKEEEDEVKLKMIELGINEYSIVDDTGKVSHWLAD